MDYHHFRQLEQAVIATARRHGYDGDPFADRPLPLGERDQEMAAVFLSLAIRPRPQTIEARRLAREWTRNIVLTSGQTATVVAPPTTAIKEKARAW